MVRVSVIIPCFNQGEFVDEAVESVLCQTFDDFEIIIVNDGSDDPFTTSHLAGYMRPKTTVVHTSNQGVAAARNRGIKEGRGPYILTLDADDRIAPTYLEQAVTVLDASPETGIVYCRAELFGEARGEWILPELSLPHMLLDNQIFSAAVFRRRDWALAGGYNPSMATGWEDWDFWLRLMALQRRVVQLPELLFFYRIQSGSRDRSLDVLDKVWLVVRLMLNNRRLYQRHAWDILRILVNGDRRRPFVPKG